MKCHLKIVKMSDLKFMKEIMYNEEIKDKEKDGFDFNRRFNTYRLLHVFRPLFKFIFKKEIIITALEDIKTKEAVGGLINSIDYSNKRASIGHVSIAEEYRGAGLGTFMIAEAIKFLREKKVKSVELSTDIGNAAAKGIYLNNGFQISGIIYQFRGFFFREPIKSSILKRILYKILLNEDRISSDNEEIKIWWVKTNKGWHTFIQREISGEDRIKQMIEKVRLETIKIKRELVFTKTF